MEFSILGPLEVRAGDRAVVLGGTKPRALLALLLLHANEAVSAERLALALWGEDAPAAAVNNVHVHMSRLRRALGDTARPRRTVTVSLSILWTRGCARPSSIRHVGDGARRTGTPPSAAAPR